MSLSQTQCNLELVSHFLQATFQILATFHQVLHVINVRKEHFHQVKKLRFICWQRLAGQYFEHVAEVVATSQTVITIYQHHHRNTIVTKQ